MKKYLTRNGVCKDLAKSPYTYTDLVGGKVLSYHFSSMLHLVKFTRNRYNNYQMIYNHIYKRFKYKVDCQVLADCNLYKKIETRGFYIEYNGKAYKCPDSIKLSGVQRITKSYVE